MRQGEDSWSDAKSGHYRGHQEDPLSSSMTRTQTEELGMSSSPRQQQGATKA